MKLELLARLKSLGFLPSPGLFLPHCGSVMLFNLERYWVQYLQNQRLVLVDPPTIFDSNTVPKLAKQMNNKSVSYIIEAPVNTNDKSVLCSGCREGSDVEEQCTNECTNELFDISKLGFTEDKCLHRFNFYPKHVSHAGLMDFDQMRECYHKYNIFFRLLRNFDKSNFIIRDVRDNSLELLYQRENGSKLLLQETNLFQPEESDIFVLQSQTCLTNWYLAIIMDKFENDCLSNYSAFHPKIAPYHVGVIASDRNNQDIDSIATKICNNLNNARVLSKVFESGSESGEYGVPFDVLVDEESVVHGHVKLLDRNKGSIHMVPDIQKLPQIFKLYWNSFID